MTATPARDALIPAYLGWSNGPDQASLRLYATDRQEATGPRWDAAFPGGRVVEYAAAERGGTEGDAYVVIRVGDRRASAREDPAGSVLAALVESGWRPNAAQLRAMGLIEAGGKWCGYHDGLAGGIRCLASPSWDCGPPQRIFRLITSMDPEGVDSD